MEKSMEEQETEKPYRVRKISARRGWAIDQIKFEYTDGKIWSVGIDGGRKDNRDFIMTEGEYIVRVTHEKLPQRWYAGASVEFETNKGRVMSFHPYLATKQSDQVITFRADQGKEIIMLKIKHGCLEGITQQIVPTLDVIDKPSDWFASVDVDGKIEEFISKKLAFESFQDQRNSILIDVIKNRIVNSTGNSEKDVTCKVNAIEKGFFIDSCQEVGGIKDVMRLFMKHFDVKEDSLYFFITLAFITVAHYIGGYSEILSGHALSNFATINDTSIMDLSLPNFVCTNMYGCESDVDARKVLILSLLITKLSSSLLYSGNIFFHSILKETRLVRMRANLFSHTLSQEMAFFDSRTVGDIQSAMNPVVIIDIIAWKVPYVLGSIFKFIVFFFYMIRINVGLTVLSILFMVLFRIILMPIDKKFEVLNKMVEKLNTMMGQTQSESLNMISSVKLFSREDLHLEEQSLALHQMKDIMMKKNFFRFTVTFITRSFNIASFCLALYFSMSFMESLRVDSGDLTAFFLLFSQIYGVYESIHHGYLDLLSQLPIAEKVADLMEKKSTMKSGPLQPDTISGQVEFRDVSFTYPSRPGQEVIKNMSMVLQPGKVTAVVGDSGAGKSTLTNLLMRLYDPSSGGIFVDGFNLKELDIPTFHKFIAVVNQNPLLFNSSIGENIAYGAPEKVVSEEEISGAAKLANAYNFIMSFRGGFDTLAGTMGTQLSGGQRQRLAIARAAIRNPKILILDEATSSLDAENEKIVTEALENIMQGRTILVIAHRLSTIRNADEILVMKNGCVVERGTHTQLLELDGVYRKLVSKQLDEGN